MFTGVDLNAYEDSLPFAGFSDRWIDAFVRGGGQPAAPELLARMRNDLDPLVRSHFVERAAEPPENELLEGMRCDLDNVVRDHLAELPHEARAWGWKEPRSIYLVPLLDAAIPSLRFLHFIRDGRDMAFSENQNQLVKHGAAVLGDEQRKEKKPIRSIALWSRVNLAAAAYGETRLGDRYLRVRFEDLCAEPAENVRRIYDFFGLEGDAEAAAKAVRPPDSLGRWRQRRTGIVEALHRTA